MTMNRESMAEALMKTFEMSYPDSYQFVDVFFQELGNALIEDGQLKLANLGSFHVRSKAKRIGRNPKTGETHEISARKAVSFTVSPTLKAKMNQDTGAKQAKVDDVLS